LITISPRFLLVAHINLKSMVISLLLPKGITFLLCNAVSNLFCWEMLRFPISSSIKVPFDADSNFPILSWWASVNAPFLWPKSSLSKMPSLSDPISTFTNASIRRSDWRWISKAISSFPVPFSPVIRILASVLAIFCMLLSNCPVLNDFPINIP